MAERAQRLQRTEESQQRRQATADMAEFHADLVCSVCQDWMVNAATIECSHTFCWRCIDTWLQQKRFECPVCRNDVTREPVKNRVLDGFVQKCVDKLSEIQKEEYKKRIEDAQKEDS